jgi:hypothetical protein
MHFVAIVLCDDTHGAWMVVGAWTWLVCLYDLGVQLLAWESTTNEQPSDYLVCTKR